MVAAAVLLGMLTMEAADGNVDRVTQDAFWFRFFVGSYFSLFLGGPALVSVLGTFLAGILLVLVVLTWTAGLIVGFVWGVINLPIALFRFVFVVFLGGLASWLWERPPLSARPTCARPLLDGQRPSCSPSR